MEIRDYIREYWRSKRRWLPLLVVVPLLAGAAAGALLAIQPAKSTAQVQARVPAPHNIGDSQIGLYIARLSEGLTLPSVQQQIVAATGIPRAPLRSLTVERREQSDQFVVTLTTTAGNDQTVAAAVAAANIGGVWVAQQDTRRIDAALKVAQEAFDQAQNALFAYQDEIGDLDPTVTYAAVSRSLVAPPPNVSTGSLRAQQEALVSQVRRYTQLREAVEMANGQVGAARTASTNQQALIATAESGELILDSLVLRQSSIRPIVEGAALAAAVAFLLVLGLSLLPDLFRRQRARPSTESTSGTTETEPDPHVTADGRERAEPEDRPGDAAAAGSTNTDAPGRTGSEEPSENRVPVHSPNSVPSA